MYIIINDIQVIIVGQCTVAVRRDVCIGLKEALFFHEVRKKQNEVLRSRSSGRVEASGHVR